MLSLSPPGSHFLQLHFNLTDATHWTSHYNGFNYEEFYEFIIDFFEADATPEAQEASAKLLEWWNKYATRFTFTLATADTSIPQSSIPEVSGHTCSRTQVGTTIVARDPATATSGGPNVSTGWVVLCNTYHVLSFHPNVIVCSELPPLDVQNHRMRKL